MLCSRTLVAVLETAVIYFLRYEILNKNNIGKLTASHLSGSTVTYICSSNHSGSLIIIAVRFSLIKNKTCYLQSRFRQNAIKNHEMIQILPVFFGLVS